MVKRVYAPWLLLVAPAAILLVGVLCGPVSVGKAQVDPEMMWHVVGHTGGQATALGVDTGRAYLGAGRRRLILEVSDGNTPVEVATIQLRTEVKGVAVGGRYAFVGERGHGVKVLDVANPAMPRVRADFSSPTPWQREDMVLVGESLALPGTLGVPALSGGHVFVTDLANSLQAVDVADPHAPRP